MIESCDSEIAGWDEDGLTFTVKDPNLFESKVIPQFFKHSKFSSFVRVSKHGLRVSKLACDILTPFGSFYLNLAIEFLLFP